MRRLRYLKLALGDLDSVLGYLADESGNADHARRRVIKLRAQCRKLADLPVTLGRPRPKLLQGLRSFPMDDYIIFFRYAGNVHSRRDLPDLFDPVEE